MKRILIVFMLGIFLISMVAAEDTTFGTYKQRDCIDLIQTCSSCSYVNILSVNYPNSTTAITNKAMTKSGSKYNYTFCQTDIIGTYVVSGEGDVDGTDTVFAYDFEITPSGFAGTLGFYILVLLLSAGIIVLGFAKNDAPIVILGSFGLYFVGIYILFFGVDGLKDPVYTWALGIIVLMLASYISIRSSYELIQD